MLIDDDDRGMCETAGSACASAARGLAQLALPSAQEERIEQSSSTSTCRAQGHRAVRQVLANRLPVIIITAFVAWETRSPPMAARLSTVKPLRSTLALALQRAVSTAPCAKRYAAAASGHSSGGSRSSSAATRRCGRSGPGRAGGGDGRSLYPPAKAARRARRARSTKESAATDPPGCVNCLGAAETLLEKYAGPPETSTGAGGAQGSSSTKGGAAARQNRRLAAGVQRKLSCAPCRSGGYARSLAAPRSPSTCRSRRDQP